MTMSKEKIKCPNCGQENPAEANFCSNCGTKLNPDAVGTKSRQLNSNQIYGIVAGLIIVAAVILYFSGVFENPSAPAVSPPPVQNAQTQAQDMSKFHNGVSLEKLREISDLETIVEKNPSNLPQLLKLANLLQDSGFYDKAIDRYKAYVNKNSKNPDAWIDMGVCFYQLKDYKNALDAMKRGLKIKPNHQIGVFNVGIVELAKGNKKVADKWFRKTVKLNPNSELGKRAKELLKQN